jgi:hypothetical protein
LSWFYENYLRWWPWESGPYRLAYLTDGGNDICNFVPYIKKTCLQLGMVLENPILAQLVIKKVLHKTKSLKRSSLVIPHVANLPSNNSVYK